MMLPTPLDENEQYITDAVQDPQEQVWATDADMEAMQYVDDPDRSDDQDVFRNTEGGLSFLNEIVEVTHEAMGHGHEQSARRAGNPGKDAIATREMGSDTWRGRTATVPVGQSQYPLVTRSSNRRSVTIVNWGPQPIYISSMPNPNINSSNVFVVPVSVLGTSYWPVTIPTRDNVWAIAAVAASTVSLLENFDQD